MTTITPIKLRLKAIKSLYNQYWEEQHAAREAGHWMKFYGYDDATIVLSQKVPERERWMP